MVETYLSLFIGICLAIVAWSLIRLERIYQYPFFMASIFLSFILPQAISLVNGSFGTVVSPAILERVLLYSCMCVAMCYMGYQFKPNSKWLDKLDVPIDERKLFRSGIVLLFIGNICFFLLSRIKIQIASNGSWTGPATILIFFAGVTYIALPIFLINALKRPNFINITLTIIAIVPILDRIIVYGRRQPTIAFFLTIGLSLFLVRGLIPPRWFFVTCVIIAAYIIPVLGQLRGSFWTLVFSGDWQTILSSSQQGLESITEKGEILELRNAALMIDAAEKLNKYSYGTGFWDGIVFQFVPGQIVGFDVKQSLQFQLGTLGDLKNLYGYNIHPGTTPTGIGDSFVEFSYFGCLTFALIGSLFKHLWVSTIYRANIVSAILYISLVDSAMVGITHGIFRFVQEFIFKAGVVFLIVYFSRRKLRINYPNAA
ncbi:hypothetical protein VB638_09020 [Dolichospermum sp. UHCC 0684]|uniref:hypothetical protein n=1 Tax=unclassified Dolichospermum TaxID=2622029 RepID=UPI0014489E28|nr:MULTISPECIES: hypothetical protein [unclassified Dolichospermum]MEA5529732.1 hypothetical protein [Dolichospermum sp. UHCC 0684]MTJ33958.1 hypothetical protein [Dolichospermum sp. UHCC 0260]